MRDKAMKRALNVGVAFAAGALAMYLLERYLRRAQRVLPAGHLARVSERPQDDAQLRENVLARLGGWVSHPRAIDVDVNNGVVRVSGQILATELEGLLLQLTAQPGVHKVHNALSVLRDPSGFGEVARPGSPSVLH
jgi:hypothetical protein